jgi:hypothetical protein
LNELAARSEQPAAALLGFLVRLVLAAAITELLELQTASGRLLVLRRRVVALLALGALQCNDFPHTAILTDPPLVLAAPDSVNFLNTAFSYQLLVSAISVSDR